MDCFQCNSSKGRPIRSFPFYTNEFDIILYCCTPSANYYDELRKLRRKEKENKKLENEFKESPEVNLEDGLTSEVPKNPETPKALNEFDPKQKAPINSPTKPLV